MILKLLLKSVLLRKIYRAVIPADTAADLTTSYTSKFEAVAAEQAANAAHERTIEVQACLRKEAALAEQARCEKAAKNIRSMLEAD